jgi:glycosyltransferase involved in cell wall biosynthesis
VKDKINLTVATEITGMGGIATVLIGYRESGFFDKWDVKIISTHTGDRRFFGLNRLTLYISALLKIVYYSVFYNVGVVHIHMATRGSYLRKSLIVRIAKLLRSKVLIHLHAGGFHEFYGQKRSGTKQAHIRRTFEMADAVVVLSSQRIAWMRETLTKTGNLHVVYNTVPSLGLDRSRVESGLVVFLGRISQRKGVLDLIRAFPNVLNACPDAKLALGGDGEIDSYQKEVEKLGIGEAVSFLGWVSVADRDALLARADVYCLPSYSEGCPMGVLEAMSAGVAVVSSKVGGIVDAIKDKDEGLLVDAGDIDALSSALITVIKNRELNQQYVNAAKNKFDRCFSTEVIMPQLDALYSEILGESS